MAAGGSLGLRDPATLLAAWEAGARAPELARGAAVMTVADREPWLDASVAQVAAGAARFHLQAFGPVVDAVVTCPGCAAVLDLEVPVADMAVGSVERDAAIHLGLSVGEVVMRAPSARDLLAAAGRADAREVLLSRCLHDANGQPIAASGLAAEDLAVVEEAFEDVVGSAVPELRVACPDCGGQVDAIVDPGELLWERVNAAAPVLLREVAELAAAFGWSEEAVLAMSSARRRVYLRLAGR